jgi:hypothetical protein
MANDVEIKVTADTSNAEGGFKKVKSGFAGMKDSIVKNKKAIGLGIAAMGVGIEALAKTQAPLTESTRKLANATGFAEDEIRGMATSLSNATFPLDSALQLMTLGAQQGLDSADALKEYATFWDTVGDATGLSAEQLAKSGAALAAVGIEVGNESELLGAFGLITQESTQTVQDFLNGIHLLAPEMTAMGISVDEAAVIMTAMERELGLTARTARTQFKEALEQSETGLSGVLEQLGLSETQLATYRGKLEESTGVIQDNADAHASTKTVLDKLKSSLGDVVFQHGALLEKASMLAPIFMVAGPAIAGFSGIMGAMSGITNIAKLAMLGLNLSMGPILLIVVGVAAAIAVGILIWKNWDKIVNIVKASFIFFKEIFVKAVKLIRENWKKLIYLLPLLLGPVGLIILAIVKLAQNWDTVWNGIKKVFNAVLDIIKTTWGTTWASIKSTFDTVSGALIGTFRTVKTTILGIWDGIVSGIKTAVNTIIGAINTVIRGFNGIKITIPSVSAPKWLGGMTWGGFSIGMPQIPEIPSLAKGGIVNRPTLAMLGESGPEAVIPLGRGGGAGMTVNLVINGDINGMDDFEQKVTSVIRDAVLGGGFQGVLARA